MCGWGARGGVPGAGGVAGAGGVLRGGAGGGLVAVAVWGLLLPARREGGSHDYHMMILIS